MTEELYINDECVDLEPGTKLTLNFKSNLLNDISKITSSNSQTIRLRKNTKNRRIIDNPSAVAYYSIYRYKRYKAQYIRNGVEVINAAYAVLLSTSEYYEIAVYWGVMANFQAWVDKGAQLTELAGTESLVWNKNITATTLSQMKSRGYGYARYDCGISNTDLANIHPSATAWWILTKIATQAGFTIEIADKYRTALREIAVPCLGRNTSKESNRAEALIATLSHGASGRLAISPADIRQNQRNIAWTATSFYVIKTNNLSDKLHLSLSGAIQGSPFTITIANTSSKTMSIWIDFAEFGDDGGIAKSESKEVLVSTYKTTSGRADIFTFGSFAETFDIGTWDVVGIRFTPSSYSTSVDHNTTCNLCAWSDWDDITYPSIYPIPQNLPEITQIDFIKAICGMLGIFVIADLANANNLKFVSLGILQDNKTKAVDWSGKLVKSNDDEPKAVEYKINDYCRNNLFKYKEDDTVSRKADGNVKIENEVIEKEKTVITLPFAPSDGSKIPQYKPSSDGTKAEAVNIKDRIMRIVGGIEGSARLTFDGLEFETLLSTYHLVLSRLLNNAIVITEKLTLNESDLKSLDYTIPFYLRQYGKFYGIISIQVSDELCEVKAAQLPETTIEEIDPPSLIINIISIKFDGPDVNAISRYPLKSDVTVNFDYYIIGEPAPISDTKVFPKGATKVTLMGVTGSFDRLELRSLSPSRDDFFNYIISK